MWASMSSWSWFACWQKLISDMRSGVCVHVYSSNGSECTHPTQVYKRHEKGSKKEKRTMEGEGGGIHT